MQPYYNAKGDCLGPDDNLQGGITASMPAGSWLGALISGILSDMFGRKTTIQVGAVIWYVVEPSPPHPLFALEPLETMLMSSFL